MRNFLLITTAIAALLSCGNPGSGKQNAAAENTADTPGSDTAGILLVANKLDNSVFFINSKSYAHIDTASTGEDPHEAIVTPDGKTAYTANMKGNSLSVIDMGTRDEIRKIDLSAYGKPHGLDISADGDLLYVTTEGAQTTLLELDVATDSIKRVFPTGEKGTHMVVLSKDEKTAYAANLGSGTTSIIDLEAGEISKTLNTGEGTEGIDITPDGKEVWVTARSGAVVIINAESNEIVEELPADGLPIRVKITPNGKQALVSCMQGGQLIVFDVATRKELKRIKPGKGPVGVLISSDGTKTFIANTQEDTVAVLDMSSLEIVDRIAVGDTPDGMAFAPAN